MLRIVPLDKIDILVDGVGCAGVPIGAGALLVGGQGVEAAVQAVQVPGTAIAQVLVEDQRLVLGEHPYGVDAGVDAVGKGEINNPVLTAERHRRLCQLLGEGVQSAPLPAGEEHGHPFLFACHNVPS